MLFTFLQEKRHPPSKYDGKFSITMTIIIVKFNYQIFTFWNIFNICYLLILFQKDSTRQSKIQKVMSDVVNNANHYYTRIVNNFYLSMISDAPSNDSYVLSFFVSISSLCNVIFEIDVKNTCGGVTRFTISQEGISRADSRII